MTSLSGGFCDTQLLMVFYNERRPHRANNYKTPDQKELAFWEKNKNRCPNKTGSDVVTDYVQTPI